MKEIFLVYPHQLFENTQPFIGKTVVLIEEPLFFTQYKFHIQKIVFHRASMKFYEKYLRSNDIEVEYFENESYIEKYSTANIHLYDVCDDWLLKKIYKNFKKITIYPNPNMLNVDDSNKFLHKYYINRRKQYNLFVTDGKPHGGQWSFDNQNRKKLPKDIDVPDIKYYENSFVQEAKIYAAKFDTWGSCKNFYYPTTFDEAKENFESFLENKFGNFGDFQDSIEKDHIFLFHSNISSAFNSGLLHLSKSLNKIIKYPNIQFNSKEGLIRQIIGWREFMFSIYKSSHIDLRNGNYFGFTNKIPNAFTQANTLLDPVDDVIKKLYKSGYNHHIERLMILGNIFLLLKINPNEVYEFFMKNYIDAYDWVMVANVYGMSQFSSGQFIVTKPYISSSNYILKMSNSYKKSQKWCEIWDGLYWSFLYEHKGLLQNNIRLKMQYALLDKLDSQKLQKHLEVAQNYRNTLGLK